MQKTYDLTTKVGMKLAETAVRSFVPAWMQLAGAGISLLKDKVFSPEKAVESQVKAQTDMLMKVMEAAKDGDEIEVEVDDGVMNGVSAKLPEYGEVSIGARANGKCKFKIRRKCK